MSTSKTHSAQAHLGCLLPLGRGQDPDPGQAAYAISLVTGVSLWGSLTERSSGCVSLIARALSPPRRPAQEGRARQPELRFQCRTWNKPTLMPTRLPDTRKPVRLDYVLPSS